MIPQQYCAAIAAQSGSSFYSSFRILPKEKREAMTAVYAFCRTVDDIVDNAKEPHIARLKLQFWRDEVEKIYTGTPSHPIAKALQAVLPRFALKQQYLNELIDGMEQDLNQTTYDGITSLLDYCYKAASTVGLLSAEIFGYQNPDTLQFARTLGIAFQLVNIIRDVGEDLNRGRIYLPTEWLTQYNVTMEDIQARRHTSEFQSLMQALSQLAREHYKQALEILPAEDRYQQRAALCMATVYFALLTEIEHMQFRVLDRKVSLGPLHKLWLVWKTLFHERKFKSL